MFHVKHPPRPGSGGAAQVFASGRLPLLERYAELLATEGVRPRPDRARARCRGCGTGTWSTAALLGAADPATARRSRDLGSGAGLPGLVLAIARPDLDGDPGRADAAPGRLPGGGACAQLGLTERRGGAWPRRGSWPGSGRFDVVTSRALAPLPRLLAWCLPLVAPARGGCWR